jgi:hypothetical protein
METAKRARARAGSGIRAGCCEALSSVAAVGEGRVVRKRPPRVRRKAVRRKKTCAPKGAQARMSAAEAIAPMLQLTLSRARV